MIDHVSSRRVFLQRGMTLLAVSATIPSFLDQTVMALAHPNNLKQQPSGKDGKILVVVQLSGGNDGLNTVIPYADDIYHNSRSNIAHDPSKVLKLDNYIGLHPNLGPLRDLLEKGKMSIVQGVGYPNPNRSHFRAMDIWQSAIPEKEIVTSGWLGRYFDNSCPGCDPHGGVAIGESQPLAMRGEKMIPLSFDRAENFRYNGNDKQRYTALNHADNLSPTTQPARTILSAKPPIVTPDQQLNFLTRTAMDAQISSD